MEYGKALLEEKRVNYGSAVLVFQAHGLRRFKAIFHKLNPGINVSCLAPYDLHVPEGLNDDEFNQRATLAIAEVDRLKTQHQFGIMDPVTIPSEVDTAYDALKVEQERLTTQTREPSRALEASG